MISGIDGIDFRSLDPRLKNREIRLPPDLSAVTESEVRVVEEVSEIQQSDEDYLDNFA